MDSEKLKKDVDSFFKKKKEEYINAMKYGGVNDAVYQRLVDEGVDRSKIIHVRLGDKVVGYYVLDDTNRFQEEFTFNTEDIHFTEEGKSIFQDFTSKFPKPSFSTRVASWRNNQ